MDLSTTHTQESGRRLRSRGVTVAIMMAITLAFSVISVPKATAFDDANPVSGVDVADWQHPDGSDIDWKSVEADGQKFAFIKATEGQGYTNPYFEDDVKQAKEAGLRVGSYHFARPGESAALQAANYANTIRTMPQPSLPPVLDIESDDGVGPEEVQRWVKEFVTEVEALTGRTPMIYTYRYFWSEQMGDTTDFKDYPLWLAAYQDEVPTELPGGWEYMTFWQRSDSGNVNGITGNTDMNLFNGSEAELDSLGTGNQVKLGPTLRLATPSDPPTSEHSPETTVKSSESSSHSPLVLSPLARLTTPRAAPGSTPVVRKHSLVKCRNKSTTRHFPLTISSAWPTRTNTALVTSSFC